LGKPLSALSYEDAFEQLPEDTLSALRLPSFARPRLLVLEALDVCRTLSNNEAVSDEASLKEFFSRWHSVIYGAFPTKSRWMGI
jgi:hypothetical protein